MVVGEGFEPSKSMTADLQSAPFGRSGTPPRGHYIIVVLQRKDYSELRSSPFGPLPLATFSRWCSSRTFEVDDGRFAVSSLMIAREPHHGVKLFTGRFLLGKRGASYQMTRLCKAFNREK